MRTSMQLAGDRAEAIAVARLRASGWTIVGSNVRVGRDELDIVAIDPGPPRTLVVAEVRWRAGREFGLPEETVDWRKRQHMHRAVLRLVSDARLPGGAPLPALPIRLDVIALEPADERPTADERAMADEGAMADERPTADERATAAAGRTHGHPADETPADEGPTDWQSDISEGRIEVDDGVVRLRHYRGAFG